MPVKFSGAFHASNERYRGDHLAQDTEADDESQDLPRFGAEQINADGVHVFRLSRFSEKLFQSFLNLRHSNCAFANNLPRSAMDMNNRRTQQCAGFSTVQN